jgi:hypothetical protein
LPRFRQLADAVCYAGNTEAKLVFVSLNTEVAVVFDLSDSFIGNSSYRFLRVIRSTFSHTPRLLDGEDSVFRYWIRVFCLLSRKRAAVGCRFVVVCCFVIFGSEFVYYLP